MTPNDRTRTQDPNPPTQSFDAALDAGLAAAFGSDLTPGGWSRPPLLRDDPSEHSSLVQPGSPEMPRGADERYQLLGEIARGGMGVVLKGRDPDLGRDLAFKVLRSELAHKPAAVQRFVEEAQVGGQLQHPGVVPVYDIGRFADGRPYFAMKLVKGRTLADLLAERSSPSDDRGRFLQHFLQVCQTVAYAHSKGVIHRDLKPSNVMVGGFGEVLVMDWGLAKVLPRGGVADEIKASRERPAEPAEEFTEIKTARFGSGSETAAGSVMGTPAFMPPEQAGGEIDKLDERADVFGLGAVLCVILTGQPPFVAGTGEAVRLMAVRGEVAPAFARLGGCGADAELVSLCRTCLSPNRDDRPRSATEVTAAVGAYLAAVEQRALRAELAKAEHAAEAREQRKRRKVQLALAAAVFLLVTGGVGFGWYTDRQAAARRADAVAKERDEQDRVSRNAAVVRTLVEQCEAALRGGVTEDAAAALSEIDRRAADGGTEEHQPRIARCRADVALLAELDRIDAQRWELSDAGDLRTRPGEANLARLDALSRYGIVPSMPPTETARRVSASLVGDRILGALQLLFVAPLGPPVPGLYETLQAVDPDEYRRAVRTARQDKSPSYVELMRRPDALSQPPWFGLAVATQSFLPNPLRLKFLEAAWVRRPGDVNVLIMLGGMTGDLQNSPEAAGRQLRWYQAAVAARPRNGYAWAALGTALWYSRSYPEAVAAYSESLRIDPNQATTHNNLGCTLRDMGDRGGAVRAFRESIRVNPKHAGAHQNLAFELRQQKQFDEAIGHCRAAIEVFPTSERAHATLVAALLDKGDLDAAFDHTLVAAAADPKLSSLFGQVMPAIRAKQGNQHVLAAAQKFLDRNPADGRAHYFHGMAWNDLQNLDRAIASYRESVRLDPTFGFAHFDLGIALARSGKLGDAIPAAREAVRLMPKHAGAGRMLARMLADAGKRDEAAGQYKEHLRQFPQDVAARTDFGVLLADRGETSDAVVQYEEAVRVNPKAVRSNPRAVLALNNLAWLLATHPDAAFRDGPRAVELATRACEASEWKDAIFIDTLAAAHAEAGDFAKAVEFQQKALTFPAFEKSDGPDARKRVEQYRRKHPYREVRRDTAPPPRPVNR